MAFTLNMSGSGFGTCTRADAELKALARLLKRSRRVEATERRPGLFREAIHSLLPRLSNRHGMYSVVSTFLS